MVKNAAVRSENERVGVRRQIVCEPFQSTFSGPAGAVPPHASFLELTRSYESKQAFRGQPILPNDGE
jgi:hypothetical protein